MYSPLWKACNNKANSLFLLYIQDIWFVIETWESVGQNYNFTVTSWYLYLDVLNNLERDTCLNPHIF